MNIQPLLRFTRILSPFQQRLCSTSQISNSQPTQKPTTIDSRDAGIILLNDERDLNTPLKSSSGGQYMKKEEKCILCKHDIKLDYKNTRILQQFVSSFSGRVYEQHITGLCTRQYKQLLRTVKYSRLAGYMPVMTKDPKYLRDPKLFDPMHPIRPHSFE